jgi:alpha-glucoside transport system ATP-binding protein
LRVATRIEIAKLHETMPETTMIYVTHDQVEAMTLADRIVVLSAGRIEQVGSPMELYHHPANLFVAQFIGSPAMNILPARVEKAGVQTQVALAGGRQAVVDIATDPSQEGKAASFGVRPEDLTVATGEDYLFQGKVALSEALGEVTLYYIEGLVEGEPIVVKVPGNQPVRRGETMRFTAKRDCLHLFDEAGKTYRR